jgi:putative endonuclease
MPPRGDPARGRAAFRRGRRAEALCRLALWLKGYRILGRGVRTPLGEIDILARRGDVLAVVEVKARPTRAAAADGPHPAQRARLARAAAVIIAARPDWAGLTLRFDLMIVTPGRWPLHLAGAWEDQRTN